MSRPTSILALAPNWLGDVAMCTPALRALAHHYPDARFTVAGRGSACALLEGTPWINRLVSIPSRPGTLAMLKLGRQLREDARDLAVVFPHSFRAAFLAYLAGARVRLGYNRGGRAVLLTRKVEPYRENGRITPVYMSREYLDLVVALGCEDDGKGLELHADPGTVAQMGERLSGEGPLVGFAPGAAFGPSKRWPAERYAAVIDTLTADLGARCVLLTGPGEEDTRDAVIAGAKNPPIICDAGRPTVETLKATISQLDLLVCNDSGPRHVAVAFGIPTVCVMGSTSPLYSVGPYERGEVIRVNVDCGPCQKPECTTDHRCMTGISPKHVAEAAVRILS